MVQEWQPDLFDTGPVGSSEQPEVRSPAADASMRARWRALILTDPVARLVRNAAHATVHQAYDLRQLALAAVDIAVASMGFARSPSPSSSSRPPSSPPSCTPPAPPTTTRTRPAGW